MDANDIPGDAIPEKGQDSAEDAQRDSKPKVYTEDEAEKKFSQQRSVLDKQVSKWKGAAEKAQAALEQLRKEQDEAELKEIGDDPSAVTLHEKKKALRDREAEIARKEAEHESKVASQAEALAALEASNREKEAKRIAAKHTVDAKLVAKYGGDDMEAFARDLPKLSETEKKRLPDSGVTTGVGQNFESIQKAYVEGNISREAYAEALKEHGKL